MKTKRDLSGIYFRFQNPESGKWENWCFEDLPTEKQIEYLDGKSPEWIRSLALGLARTINTIAEQFDITNK